MADQDPYAAIATPVAQQAPSADPYASMATPSAADLTANRVNPATKTGYGTYKMVDQSGATKDIPYFNVPQAAQQGYGFADDQSRMSYMKDVAFDPNRKGGAPMPFTPAAGDPRASVAYQQQMEQNLPAPMQAVAGLAKAGGTIMRPALDVMALKTGTTPQQVSDMLAGHGAIQNLAKYGALGTAAATAIPAALAAPVATAAGLGGGLVGATAGELGGTIAGLSPQQTQVLSDIGGVGGGAVAGFGANMLTSRPPSRWAGMVAGERPYQKLANYITGSKGQSPVVDNLSQALQAQFEKNPQMIGTGARNSAEFSKAVQTLEDERPGLKYADLTDPLKGKTLDMGPLPENVKGFKLADGSVLGPNPTFERAEQALAEANEKSLYTGGANAPDPTPSMQAKAVAANLRGLLNDRIGQLSGMDPVSVGALREHGGQIGTIVANARQRGLVNLMGTKSVVEGASQAGTVRSMPAAGLRAPTVEPVQDWQFRRLLTAAENAAQAKAAPAAPPMRTLLPQGPYYAPLSPQDLANLRYGALGIGAGAQFANLMGLLNQK